ncbi:Protocadherin-11 Y-linked [Paragonimus heterotremus]|uniref:Protocadherin-11 Y-linked n=1 Tax=Paragonimus heterotremus TaxID=100268 RepID=A0A8J4WKG0_9TREM|nr:Protocadherin-11 Y-linked [Paragonimus heterotremus]
MTFSLAQPLNTQERLALQYFGIRTVSSNQAAIYVIQTPDVDSLHTRAVGLSDTNNLHSTLESSEPVGQEFTFHAIVRDNGYPHQLSSRAKITVRVQDVNDMAPAIFVSFLNTAAADAIGTPLQDYSTGSLATERNRGLVLENVERAFIAFVNVQDFDSGPWGQVQCRTNNEAFLLVPVTEAGLDAKHSFPVDSFSQLHQPVTTASANSGDMGFKLLAVKPFDREKTSEVSFHIICVDNPSSTVTTYMNQFGAYPTQTASHNYNAGGLSGAPVQLTGTSAVRVIVADENDNPPVFLRNQYTFALDEVDGSIMGSSFLTEFKKFVGQVTASDPDPTSKLAYLLDSSSDDTFSIDKETGKLYSKRPFDREQLVQLSRSTGQPTINGVQVKVEPDGSVYLVPTVTVTDGLHNVSTSVRVLIQDVNDNVPVFAKLNYEFTVPENEQPVQSSTVGVVEAQDADVGWNAQITYRLLDIHEQSSERFKKDLFDHQRLPSRSCFTVSSKSGQLRLLRKLDREQQTHHIFYVLAIDNPKEESSDMPWKFRDTAMTDSLRTVWVSHTATATVTIIVADVNDNAPKITHPPSHGVVNVEAGTLAGHNLFTVVAEDPDAGENGTVRYTLALATFERVRQSSTSGDNSSVDQPQAALLGANEETHQRSLFSIDETTGMVFAVEKLAEQTATYLLVIGAHDLGKPEQRRVTSTVTVRIQNSQLHQALSAGHHEMLKHETYPDVHKMRISTSDMEKSVFEGTDQYSLHVRKTEAEKFRVAERHLLKDNNLDHANGRNGYGNVAPRGRYLSLADRTVVIILATIFTLLLMITVVLVLLIKRRRDQEHHRGAIQKTNYDCQPTNNAMKVELLHAATKSPGNSSHVMVDGTNVSYSPNTTVEFASLSRMRPILLHEGQEELRENSDTLDYDTRLYGKHNVYHTDGIMSVISSGCNDYQQVLPTNLFTPSLPTSVRNKTETAQDVSLAEKRNMCNSVELLTLPGMFREGCNSTRKEPAIQPVRVLRSVAKVDFCPHPLHAYSRPVDSPEQPNNNQRTQNDRRYQTIGSLSPDVNVIPARLKNSQLHQQMNVIGLPNLSQNFLTNSESISRTSEDKCASREASQRAVGKKGGCSEVCDRTDSFTGVKSMVSLNVKRSGELRDNQWNAIRANHQHEHHSNETEDETTVDEVDENALSRHTKTFTSTKGVSFV